MSVTVGESSDAKLCPDWVFLNNSDVSVAKDRGWFKNIHTIYLHSTARQSHPWNCNQEASRWNWNRRDSDQARSLSYRNQVSWHNLAQGRVTCPSATTNVLGLSVLREGYSVKCGGGEPDKWKGTITDDGGQVQAFFDSKKELHVVKLRGPPAGPEVGSSWIDAQGKSDIYLPSFQWPSTECRKWEAQQTKNQSSQPASRKKKPSPKNEAKVENAVKVKDAAKPNYTKAKQERSKKACPPYTAAEKAFLKSEWRTEYHFLLHHGLRIYHEDDREEGRLILRAIIADKVAEDEDDDDDELEGHRLDCNFTFCQLFWIEKHYENVIQFMRCHGLKDYVDDDVKEAELLVRVLRKEEAECKDKADGSDEQDDGDSDDRESDDDQFEGH